jgi:hypothetical protein
MTKNNFLNPVIEQVNGESDTSVPEAQSIDERMMNFIRQNYQISHQEEFLQIRTQTEALLMEIRQFAGHQSKGAKFTL